MSSRTDHFTSTLNEALNSLHLTNTATANKLIQEAFEAHRTDVILEVLIAADAIDSRVALLLADKFGVKI